MTDPAPQKKRRHEVSVDKCNALVDALWKQDGATAMFQKPVAEADAPGYFTIIDTPMDLSTMRCKLQTGRYKSNRDVIADARLMLNNALEYNARGDPWYRHAKSLRKSLPALLETCGLAKYDDVDSGDDDFVPTGRAVDKEKRFVKDEKKAQENVPDLLKSLQDDLEIPLDELKKKYAAAATTASSKSQKANGASDDDSSGEGSDDDDDDRSTLTSCSDDEEESSCTSSSSDEEDDED